ncbi:unnamed protein product [Orchesella dallaii]|uniref:Uncharacterized protein n=1 Tax=Orchesella dallaii TaxID=48710 RepID=A0ABP1RIF2_9HEXA
MIRTTLLIPELKCECRDSSSTYVRPADADDYINEIDIDDHDQSSARGPMRRKHPRRYGQRRDQEDFVKNLHGRKFTRMQKRQRKLAGEGGSKNRRLLRENQGSRRISSTPTRTPVFTLPIRSCHTRTTCQSCVNTKLTTATHNCFWEVSSVGQGCVEKFTTPIEGLFNIAYNEAGCTSVRITSTPRTPTKVREPCPDKTTCETCVRRATSPGLRILSTCLWVETPSNGHYCASSFSPLQKIDKIAFTLNGCATSSPHQTCEQQETCEACVATRLEGGKNETCVWEVKTTGQRCAPDYTRSQEITNVVFSQSSCPFIQPANEIIRTTLVIPELKCECPDSSSTYARPADADDYINEIDVDDHDQSSARGPIRRKHPRRHGQRRDHAADFVKNINSRKFNRIPKRQRKLAGEADSENQRFFRENEVFLSNQMINSLLATSDPCIVGINCESCVRTLNGDNGQGSCVWVSTSGGSLCVTNYIPSQEIASVFFNVEECETSEGWSTMLTRN